MTSKACLNNHPSEDVNCNISLCKSVLKADKGYNEKNPYATTKNTGSASLKALLWFAHFCNKCTPIHTCEQTVQYLMILLCGIYISPTQKKSKANSLNTLYMRLKI